MSRRGAIIGLGTALLVCATIIGSRRPTNAQNDLTVTFLSLTNDPGPSVFPTLSVLSDGKGLHALFAVTNIGPKAALQFGILAIETQGGSGSNQAFPTGFDQAVVESGNRDGWRATEAGGFFTAPMGMLWAPGHGCVYAVPWPRAVKAQTPWRLRLWVKQEPNIYLALINQRLGRELFRPRGDHAVTSDVVEPIRLRSSQTR